jgi:type I restriction enzyme, R subunit
MNEAETCRTMVRPKLEAAGWLANGERHYREQLHITAGRVVLAGGKPKRQKHKIPDFLLYFTRDLPWRSSRPSPTAAPRATGCSRRRGTRRRSG